MNFIAGTSNMLFQTMWILGFEENLKIRISHMICKGLKPAFHLVNKLEIRFNICIQKGYNCSNVRLNSFEEMTLLYMSQLLILWHGRISTQKGYNFPLYFLPFPMFVPSEVQIIGYQMCQENLTVKSVL